MFKQRSKRKEPTAQQLAPGRRHIVMSQRADSSRPHLDLPVVSGGLVKLLPQLERDFRVLEGALGFQGHLVALHRDDGGGFGHVAHLPGGEAHTCREGGAGGQK